MQRSLREALAESHVAAVAIVVLLMTALDAVFQVIFSPLSVSIINFLFTAIAILGAPSITFADPFLLTSAAIYLSGAIVSFLAAWLLSRWVFGTGPLGTLRSYRGKFTRGNHV